MKKQMLLLTVFVFFLLTHVHWGFRATLGGKKQENLYSPVCFYLAYSAANSIAEELCPDSFPLSVQYRLHFSLYPPSRDVAALTHAILNSCPELATGDCISLGHHRLGVVESAAIFKERLHAAVYQNLPGDAIGVCLSMPLHSVRIYSTRQHISSYEQLLAQLWVQNPPVYLRAESLSP